MEKQIFVIGALERYCNVFRRDIHKVTTIPYWFAGWISTITGSKPMKCISNFMSVFERIGERVDPSEANRMLGLQESLWMIGFAPKKKSLP